jgi:hypothetical protein
LAQSDDFTQEALVSTRMQLINSRAMGVIEAAPAEVLLFIGVTAGLGIAIDLAGMVESGVNLIVNIATIALGYVMTSAMLRRTGLAPDGLANGFRTYFGISLLGGAATLLGLLLLIVPGIVLLVRWAPAMGFGLASGRSATESLGDSWHATKGHFWPILIALLIPAGLFIAGMAIYLGPLAMSDEIGVIPIVVGNLLMMAASVASAAIGVAVYGLLVTASARYGDVFE